MCSRGSPEWHGVPPGSIGVPRGPRGLFGEGEGGGPGAAGWECFPFPFTPTQTKTGNAHVQRVLVESARSYRHPARTTKHLRHTGADASPEAQAIA